MRTEKVYFTGILKCGACIQGACVTVPEDYTMRQLVDAIKAAGYIKFMTVTMRRFADVR